METAAPGAAGERLAQARRRLQAWIEAEQFRGWDPFDALNSPLLRCLAFGNRRLGQGWVQLFKRSPLNLRPLLGVPKGYNPKGMGLFLAAYLRRAKASRDPAHLDQARFFAGWLIENASPGYHGAGWGYNFDWPNRGFFAPAGTPTIVNTAFNGLALLDFYYFDLQAALPEAERQSALAAARSACDFIQHDLNRLAAGKGQTCFSYTPLDRRFIHNANLMGAWLLAEVAACTGEGALADLARQSAAYTVACQQADGAWKYGEAAMDGWVDNFHTGFVLVALRRLAELLGQADFAQAAQRGYAYWKAHFFLPDGAPRYTPQKAYPLDIHSVAQAMITGLEFAGEDPGALALAERTALWGVEHMQDRQGYFHYQIQPAYRIRIPYMRWSQAWMLRALVALELEYHEHLG